MNTIAVGMLGDDRRQVLVDRARGLASDLGLERVHELERRAGDRLHVHAHLVHVLEALLDGRETPEHVLHLLLVRRAREIVGEAHRRLGVAPEDVFHHVVGRRVVDVAMDVDAEVSAATLRLA
jgi:hypothetical protein